MCDHERVDAVADKVFKNCHVVCSLRDNLTLRGETDSLSRWTDIAMEIAERYRRS
jgi:hypothetical protein